MATLPFFIVHIQAVTKSPGPYATREIGYPHFPKTVGEHIRKHRLDLKLLQKDVARTIGCTALTLVNWEKGHTQPSVKHKAGVIKFLGFKPHADKSAS
jgi:DNA-binding XRE family transcriptional regulator